MIITDIENQTDVHAEISKATKKDIKDITKAKTFVFDWKRYLDSEEHQIYKLYTEETKEILGLMCLKNWPEPGFEYVEVVTLELRKDQIGKRKRYGRLAGCLFAFAASVSYENGFQGWISLVAKTKTAPIFAEKYGFHHIGMINSLTPKMASDHLNSSKLIQAYL